MISYAESSKGNPGTSSRPQKQDEERHSDSKDPPLPLGPCSGTLPEQVSRYGASFWSGQVQISLFFSNVNLFRQSVGQTPATCKHLKM
jgi:hypothetical protein